ncbi:MAG: hypothetical protein HGA19_23005 [Oscillochloris sp.]|nr:hypothetical protein [Oscillochloris sp.]
MLDYDYIFIVQDRHKRMLDESLRLARLYADLPRSRPVYAPLLAHLGTVLVMFGANLRARYSESAVFADEGTPEGVVFARSVH